MSGPPPPSIESIDGPPLISSAPGPAAMIVPKPKLGVPKPSRSSPSPSSAEKRPSVLAPPQTTADGLAWVQLPAATSGAAASATWTPPSAGSVTVRSLRSPGSPRTDTSRTENSGPLTPPSTRVEPVTVAAWAGAASSRSTTASRAVRIPRDVT